MARAFFPKICFLLSLVAPLSFTSAQVSSNYIPLDQVGRQQSTGNSVRASTYPEGEEPAQRASIRASTTQDNVQSEQTDEEEQNLGNISNVPLSGVTATTQGIDFPGVAIAALGSDPVKAYTAEDYPGIGRSAVQRVKDTQAQYAESLASQDIVNLLGHPFLKMSQGSGRCADGQSGQFASYYYLIREGSTPRSMAVVRFCADGMQNITIQNLR